MTLIAAALVAGSVTSAEAEGLYVGGSLGKPDYSSSINGIGGGGGGSGTGLKAYLGAQLSPNFAVEGGLIGLGHTSDSTGTVNGHGLSLDGVGSYEFAPNWSLLGRLGVADARFTTPLGDGSSPALKLGTGLQYDLSKQLSLRLEYERYRFANAFDSKANVGETTFGLKFGF